MMTIRTTGDDAHDTDARLVNALVGYHVTLGERSEVVEILGVTDSGRVYAQPVPYHGGEPLNPISLPLHNLTITVL